MSDELDDRRRRRATSVADQPKAGQHLGWALVLISIAQLMVVLDATIANIALPFIGKDLDITGINLTWIVTGYTLVVRRPAAARRPARRPLRPPPDLHDRPRRLRRRLAARRPRAERDAAARRPGPPGLRCRAGLARPRSP